MDVGLKVPITVSVTMAAVAVDATVIKRFEVTSPFGGGVTGFGMMLIVPVKAGAAVTLKVTGLLKPFRD